MTKYEAILTDIEGTTTPISFVKSILFSYITTNIHEFLSHHWNEPELMRHIDSLQKQSEQDKYNTMFAEPVHICCTGSAGECINKVMEYVEWNMKMDRKCTALKAFQGFMWKEGFENGKLKGVVYDDVLTAFERWNDLGVDVYIYSSGSVEAQKLLFGFSDKGDLTKFLKGFYDTTIGSKVDRSSYEKISTDIGVEPEGILFMSDNPREIEAAKEAGFQVRLAIRPGNDPVSKDAVPFAERITSFDELF